MRPSTTTSARASHAPGSQAPPSATLLARLADKKKEVEAVEALQRASSLFLRRLEGLAEDCEVMADAGIGACMYPRARAWPALGRTPRCLFLLSFSSVRFAPVTDLIFGGFRNVLLGVCFSAWPGARAMAPDVPYTGFVRYVHSHLRVMTTRIIPVSPQQLHGKHHQRQ